MFSDDNSWFTILAVSVDSGEFLGVSVDLVSRGDSSDFFFQLLRNGLGDSASCKPSFQAIFQFRLHQYISSQGLPLGRHSMNWTFLVWGRREMASALPCFQPGL